MFGCDCLLLHIDVFILVWGWIIGAYLIFRHVRCCLVAGCSRLLGFCFLDMAALQFSLISLVDHAYVGHLCCGDFLGDCSYMCKSSGALFAEVVDTNLGDVEAIVEVVDVGDPMD